MAGYTLGLDIGSNSVGSAWVDLKKGKITFGDSVFPAGVEERDDKRGAPKNQAKRRNRSLRRSIKRRAERKRRLRGLLMEVGLLPGDAEGQRRMFGPRRKGEEFDLEKWNPWRLRREGLERELEPFEFGRVLIHLNQRRGAVGFDVNVGDKGSVKGAIDSVRMELLQRYGVSLEKRRILRLRETKEEEDQKRFSSEFTKWMGERSDVTFGRMMADLFDERRDYVLDKRGERKRDARGGYKYYHCKAIRNRQDSFEFHADRRLIRDEFKKLWEKQKSYDGALSRLLTERLRKQLDDPDCELHDEKTKKSWWYGGAIFGQRQTYWKTGTLGRCDLEPSDRCVVVADMYAQEFRVLDYVNNLRIKGDRASPILSGPEREKVIAVLRKPQYYQRKGEKKVKTSIKATDVEKTLGIDKKSLAKREIPAGSISLSISEEGGQEGGKVVSDWFYRDIACGVFGEDKWSQMGEKRQDSVNRAILKYDPEKEEHENRLRKGAQSWWKLSEDEAERLVMAWKSRPRLEERLNLSRKAIRNLLVVMREPDPRRREEYPNQIRARRILAHDFSNSLTAEQRVRYAPKPTEEFKKALIEKYGEQAATRAIRQRGLNKRARHYMKKHPNKLLPPAPELANPVVRKAIHEVRQHLLEHLRQMLKEKGSIVLPDRVVVELAREGRQAGWVRDAIYRRNKVRRDIRERIIKDYGLEKQTRRQQQRAIERVLLCRQQNYVCPYTSISAKQRKEKGDVEDGVCVYSGKAITELQAVLGTDVEVDHIVPYSRCGDDSINNKVLCYRDANRDKGNQTPKERMGEDSEEFKAMEQRMRHLDVKGKDGAGPPKEDYFTKKDYKRKWDNLRRDPEPDEFRKSQLCDTAYAAKQVGDYLRAALYDGESDGKQHVFFTNGKLTARLRNDWLLYRKLREAIKKDEPEAKEKDEWNRQKAVKDRGDHRHHAIDAVVIALTPDYINKIAEDERYGEEYYQRTGYRANRKRMEVPKAWRSVEEFRRAVLSRLYATFDDWGDETKYAVGKGTELIVSHRPEKRRLVGALHKENPYGKTDEPGVYVSRQRLDKLVGPGKDSASWVENILDDGTKKIIKARLSEDGIEVVKTKPKKGRPAIKFVDSKTGKGVKKADVKKALSNLCMVSGVPIRSIKVKTVISDPVPVLGSDGVERFYESDNNHHLEILKDKKTKEWKADAPIRMYDAARRNAERLDALKKAGVPSAQEFRKLKRSNPERYRKERERWKPIIARINAEKSIVDRNDRDGKEFVMSLAIGETLRMRHKQTKEPGYFVVFKLEKDKIWVKPHWDARRAKGKKVENPREEICISPRQLQELGVEEGKGPQKVWVGPLGDVKVLRGD